MNTTRMKLLVIGLTVLGLSAGVVAGMLVSRLPATAEPAGAGPHGPPGMSPALVEQLQLTPQQQDEMKKIWEGVRGDVQQCFQRAQDLQKQRDDKILEMLTPEQKAQFEKISTDYAQRFDSVTQEREHAFQTAVDRTRSLLNDTQREKYDQIIKNRLGRVPPPGTGAPPPPPPAAK
jgi:Spy/CpxP family protein refolding chaperone